MSGYIGKTIRLERIMNRDDGKTIIVPLDHGLTVGPIKGLTNDLGKTVNQIALGGANAVLGHIGIPLYAHRGYGPDIGLILHLSGSTSISPSSNYKVLVNSVLEAVKIGADGVSIHINIGTKSDPEMLETLGNISRECREFGMPLLAMMYPRGENIKDEHDKEVVKIAVRVAAELGADIVKTNWTGDPDSFKEVIDGCMVPVIIAGGKKASIKEILEITKQSIDVGGAGVAFGRNVFQAENPTKVVSALHYIVHKRYEVEEAIKEVNL
ncbi:MAG: fructose-bisphosphate aldolase [Candidatus Lokiarchaeota archaeon]|nr:fructose-bisphosphate aldolase [Candidatus Lokiarchaeota archaeon]MBD3201379.1 fructose-bisphosphate aldolase [Candidatus Lokiarchaeota archaeon]